MTTKNDQPQEEQALVANIIDAGVSTDVTTEIKKDFLPFYKEFEEMYEKVKDLKVTDISETDKMKSAKETRLALSKVRIAADNKRKELKENSTRYNNAVQSVYNWIENKIKPVEEYLKEQEKFKEIWELKERNKLIEERVNMLSEFVGANYDRELLGTMGEEIWKHFYNGVKSGHEEKIRADRERKEAEERAAIEKREALERDASDKKRIAELEAKLAAMEKAKDGMSIPPLQEPTTVNAEFVQHPKAGIADSPIAQSIGHGNKYNAIFLREWVDRYKLDSIQVDSPEALETINKIKEWHEKFKEASYKLIAINLDK